MELLPKLVFDSNVIPRRRREMVVVDPVEDLLLGGIELPRFPNFRWRNLAAATRDTRSTIKTDKNKFQVNLDVQHFAPEEITVKTVDGYIVIEGQHEEKQDEHGYVSRQFKRRYALPEDCKPETVQSTLSSDGVLSVIAPRASEHKDERLVPITRTGPVRRKPEDEEVNGEPEEEAKTPQKKRKR